MNVAKSLGRQILSVFRKSAPNPFIAALSPEDKHILAAVREYTMTSPERVVALIDAVRYIERAGIKGDIVECGVWRGGSSMGALKTLDSLGSYDRSVYLYDTFEGMSEPTSVDREALSGSDARAMLEAATKQDLVWAHASLDDVKSNIATVNYPVDKIHFVVGKVEDTIPGVAPERIALLRLDTDWYESTKHELEHLYDRLEIGGVLIIDDYGHWEGAKRAVDEYFAARNISVLLCRVDYTGRIAIKM